MDDTFKIEGFDQEINDLKLNKSPEINKKSEDNEIVKISLNMYKDDWEALFRFRTYMITKKKTDYSQSQAFIYGLKLLQEKYKIKRDMPKVKLSTGPRGGTDKRPKKNSSIDLPSDSVKMINDFLYYRIMEEGLIKYSRLEMISEMVELIKKNNKEVIWK